MGSRTYIYYTCPKCGKTDGVEIYAAPSCLQYSEACQYCDFRVDLNYYEDGPDKIRLCSHEEAKNRGLIDGCDERDLPSFLNPNPVDTFVQEVAPVDMCKGDLLEYLSGADNKFRLNKITREGQVIWEREA